MSESSANNPYSRLNYRRLIAWPQRIERESPFLEAELGQAPEPSVVDLGCGTGEHARHLASKGFQAMGIDRSPEQVEKALEFQDEFAPCGPQFICGPIEQLSRLTRRRFGAAVCLGNVLPHLDDELLQATLDELADLLLPGGRLVVQLLNYERIMRHGVRNLPLNIRDEPDGEGEIVFLRLVQPEGERFVKFFPSSLVLRPGEDPPLRVESSKEVRLRAWRRDGLEALLAEHSFEIDGIYGDMTRGPFEGETSADLVLAATLQSKRRSSQNDRK